MIAEFREISAPEGFHIQAHLLDSADQALLAVDVAGRVVYWNLYASKIFGWNPEEAFGRDLGELLASPSVIQSIHEHSSSRALDCGWSEDFQVARRDRTTLTAHLGFSLIPNTPQVLLGIVCLVEDSSDQYRLKEANRLLAEAGALLSDNLDYLEPLKTLARLAVPSVADWCTVHLLSENGSIEQVAVAPLGAMESDPVGLWLRNDLAINELEGLSAVLRSEESKLVTEVAASPLATAAAIQSYMMIPLKSRTHAIGAMTFITAASGRRLDRATLGVAETLASQVATYLNKATRVQKSQDLNIELGQRVDDGNTKLRTAAVEMRQSESTIRTLFRISNNLNSTLDIQTILDQLATEAISLIGGENGFAGLSGAGA